MKNPYRCQRIYKIALLVFIIIDLSSISHATETTKLKHQVWPFDGIFGKVDRQAAQRGFQIYKEVCSACHTLIYLSYRNLKDIGFSEEEVKELAKNYVFVNENEKTNKLNNSFDINENFIKPYANEQLAKDANNGVLPPDLSLIIKARKDGANYIFSILTGYKEAPNGFKILPGLYYNQYFPNHQIAMSMPLVENQVVYMDGTKASVDQMARDVTIFLQWVSEPEMEHRKSLGLKVLIFLVVCTLFFFLTKNNIWRRFH